jgi:hypothetical protein
MFRAKKAEDGSILEDENAEVEIDFMGGGKKRLVGGTAVHFLKAMGKFMG